MSDQLKEEIYSDELLGAMTATADKVIVKAEDIALEGGGIDYAKHFFSPQVGKSYTLKFLPNLGSQTGKITHRKIYKNLPDPTRKGKRFQYVSSGNAKTDKVLEAFFELNNLKKAGDVLATQKLDEYFGVTNQGCSMIQVLNSPDKEEIGIVRMFDFSTFGPNATVANLLNAKLNPTEAKIAEGFEEEDVFNAFESSVMILQCDEAIYDGRKGRDFSKSEWGPKKRGAIVNLYKEDGTTIESTYTLSSADLVDGKLRDEAKPAFMQLVKLLKSPEMSIHNYFAYKTVGDKLNTEDTEKYLISVNEKVDEIIPVLLKATTMVEIENYGKGVASTSTEGNDSAQIIGGGNAADILKNSAPNELMGSILGDQGIQQTDAITTPVVGGNADVDSILNG